LRVNGRNTALKKSCGGKYHMRSSGWKSMKTIGMKCGLPDWPTYRRYALTSISIIQQVKRVWV